MLGGEMLSEQSPNSTSSATCLTSPFVKARPEEWDPPSESPTLPLEDALPNSLARGCAEEWDQPFESPTLSLEDALVAHPNFSGSHIWRNGDISSPEDRNPAPENALVEKRDRRPCTHSGARGASNTEDGSWVLYIPIYVPDFVLTWLRRIEFVATDHIQESFTDGKCRVTYLRQKSMTPRSSGDRGHACTQTEWWDGSEAGRVERLAGRLAVVESGKALLAGRLRREEARCMRLEEERAQLSALLAHAAPATGSARLLLPPSFSRPPSELSGVSSPVAYDMAYSSLLGL